MNIVTDIRAWQQLRLQLTGKSIGFVPTMGNLHAGHESLCLRARAENNIVIVSIFINPTQFNQTEDYKSYPRTLEQDKVLLRQLQVDYLLLFTEAELYPDQYQVQVTETDISQSLEGKARLGHFTGMLTIVLKLFNLVMPHRAYFGEKDYQQLLLVKKMVHALFLPITIVACETIRAEDQLALSSRNSRLSPQQRQQAALLPQLLQSSLTREEIIQHLINAGFAVDYVAEYWQRRLAAVWLEDVRLIDNAALNIEE